MTERITAAELLEMQAKPKGQKNAAGKNARGLHVDGVWFASRHEYRVWQNHVLLEKGGEITNLRRQVPIPLMGRNGPILTPTGKQMVYVADIVYLDNGEEVVKDAKGHPSEIYPIKKAILAAQGIEIIEV